MHSFWREAPGSKSQFVYRKIYEPRKAGLDELNYRSRLMMRALESASRRIESIGNTALRRNRRPVFVGNDTSPPSLQQVQPVASKLRINRVPKPLRHFFDKRGFTMWRSWNTMRRWGITMIRPGNGWSGNGWSCRKTIFMGPQPPP
jgi:hypothetical protein